MKTLLAQHTTETGQEFTDQAGTRLWHLTQGQPWLVNALAYECCFEIKEGRDRSRAIDKDMVDQAKENLIARRETHLDQLADKLQEERVQRVIEPILEGAFDPGRFTTDDIEYVEGLGFINTSGQMAIGNPFYQEFIPRSLTRGTRFRLGLQATRHVKFDGHIDANKLLSAFQEFFREHSEIWLERFQYKEAAPQLLVQAFLQRIINSGGRIEREYGLGRMRTDLFLLWPLNPAAPGAPYWTRWQGPVQKVVIELKILYKSLARTISEGLKQTHAYMERCDTSEGHLVVFNDRPEV